MKRLLLGLIFLVAIACSHFFIQTNVPDYFASVMDKKTAELSEKVNNEVAYTVEHVYFDYLRFATVADNLQVTIQNTVIVDVSELAVAVDEDVEISDIKVLSVVDSGGALQLLSTSTVLYSEKKYQGELSSFDFSVDGLKVGKSFYSQFLPPGMGSVFALLFEKNGVDVKLTYDGSPSDGIHVLGSRFYSSDSFEFKAQFEYYENVISLARGTSVDPLSGMPTSIQGEESVEMVIDSFSLSLSDLGVRDALFQYGASTTVEPSLDSGLLFKENIVNGLSVFVNQILEQPMLPGDSLSKFVQFVDVGGEFYVDVDLAAPVEISVLGTHLFGYPQPDIYKDAVYQSGVR